MTIVANPRAYKVPDWFLNRQKDVRDGRFSQVRRAKGTGSGLLSLRPCCAYSHLVASIAVPCWL
mgnify:CR=1 FL=1